MATDILSGGNIEPRALEDEMRTAYLDYAMSVIVGRALPDVRDGLKPVHRRVLYAMNESGLGPTRPYVKCARIVGEVMGNYHPHGDSAIYDTLVRMAQDFSHALPARRRPGQLRLDRRRPGRGHAVHGGPPDADRAGDAARPRHGHGRLRAELRRLASSEPLVLPSRFPNLLVNGSSGIAVGMATNIPPHNLREVIDATIAFIDNPHDHRRGADAAHHGPGLPDRRHHPRPAGHPRRLRDRPRPRARAREGARSRTSAAARRRSSSPSCPSWSRRAATAA